jgi:hypothetical protein
MAVALQQDFTTFNQVSCSCMLRKFEASTLSTHDIVPGAAGDLGGVHCGGPIHQRLPAHRKGGGLCGPADSAPGARRHPRPRHPGARPERDPLVMHPAFHMLQCCSGCCESAAVFIKWVRCWHAWRLACDLMCWFGILRIITTTLHHIDGCDAGRRGQHPVLQHHLSAIQAPGPPGARLRGLRAGGRLQGEWMFPAHTLLLGPCCAGWGAMHVEVHSVNV